MEIYLNIGHVGFLANVRMLKFGSELRYGIRSPNVRTPVDIPSEKGHTMTNILLKNMYFYFEVLCVGPHVMSQNVASHPGLTCLLGAMSSKNVRKNQNHIRCP